MSKIQQFVHLKDSSGVLKNLSETLQESRDKNIETLFLAFTRSDGSIRTFWHGNKMAEINLLLDTMKHDFITNRFETYDEESYLDKSD